MNKGLAVTVEKSDNLLIYIPVPLFQSGQGYLLEDQACNGLRLWAENFEKVTVMVPVEFGTPPPSWKPIETVGPNLARIKIVPLPTAYRPDQFLKHYRASRDVIRAEIANADFMSFSIGGLFGDWGSVACYEAHRQNRRFAIWTDRVESEVVRRTATSGSMKSRIRSRLTHRPMAALERFLIKRSTIGLFHGKETFDTYAPFCKKPILVHDIHLTKADHISSGDLKAKTARCGSGPIKIGYMGRAEPMKGPLDWVEVLAKLVQDGTQFEAFWMGDGSQADAMRAKAKAAGIADKVSFPGFIKDRDRVLDTYRAADIFMFCHKTPESPRCLIEALVSGTPIIGYDGTFARDLIKQHQGGRLVPLDDVNALAGCVSSLAQDPTTLANMMENAAKDGAPYDDVSVFTHRSNVIREHLS